MKQSCRIRQCLWITATVSALAARAVSGQTITIDFESFSGTSFYDGTSVPGPSQLSDQLLTTLGAVFRSESGSPFVAVVALGPDYAPSGINGIGGVNSNGQLSYATPFRVEFFLPSDPTIPAATDFVSLRGDLLANGNHLVELEAFDVGGSFLGGMTQVDSEPWTLSFSGSGIHSLRISQAPVAFSAAFDDLTFNRLVAVPEPSALSFVVAGGLVLATHFLIGKRRRRS